MILALTTENQPPSSGTVEKSVKSVDAMTQTVAIIKLNWARFVKGKARFVIVLLFAITVLPFIVIKSRKSSSTTFSTSTAIDSANSRPVSPFPPIYTDFSSLTAAQQAEANTKFAPLNAYTANNLTYAQFTSGNGSSHILVTFQSWNPPSYQYTLTTVSTSGLALSNLWVCLTPKNCLFNPVDMHSVALVEQLINSVLSGTTPVQALVINEGFYNGAAWGVQGTSFYLDIYFLAIAAYMTSSLIEEKTKGLKFGLFMTGIRRPAYYVGTLFLPFVLAIVWSAVVIYMTYDNWNSSPALGPLIIFIFATSFCYLSFFFVVSQICSLDRSATLLALIFVAGGYVTQFENAAIVANMPSWAILILTFITPRIGLSVYQEITTIVGAGATGFSNTYIPYSAPSVNQLLIVSCFSFVAWLLLAIYLDWLQVSKEERRPLHYIFSQFFKKDAPHIVDEEKLSKPQIEEFKGARGSDADAVIIENLTKRYPTSSTNALTRVSLEFYKGEIFGLLGYNGAGKSTFINVLVGVLSPSEGSVRVFGHDSSSNRYDIAASTGICSQDDILYDDLSAAEHLYYFGLMRGVPSTEIGSRVEGIIQDLEMEGMKDRPSKSLSGGQKRKLCVALAFVNDPSLVVLDEMSSGVDPENRRVIWNFLLKRKEGRAILLCTHFMDEADVVCGRKAMLTKGQLVCVGSSVFLKQVYDTGYTITIEKRSNDISKGIFDEWFTKNGVKASCVKAHENILEYKFGAKDLAFVSQFEKDEKLSASFISFSLKENGLEDIFSSKSLVDENTIQSSPEEKEKLLRYIGSFKEPDFVFKLKAFFLFETRRTASSLLDISTRLFLSIALIIILWIVIQATNVGSYTSTVLGINNDFINRLVPPGNVIETNITSLLTSNPSQFVSLNGTTSSQVKMATLYGVGSSYSLYVWRGYVGASFLAVQSLFSSSTINSNFEFVSNQSAAGIGTGTQVIVMIILSQIYFDILLFLVDEVSESREKIKFLLLASGVPIEAYWTVSIVRNALVTLPFMFFASVAITSSFSLSGGYIFIYMLQTIPFAAFLGSVLPKNDARGVVMAFRYGNLVVLILFFILYAVLNMNLQPIVDILIVISPWSPISVSMALLFGSTVRSEGLFYGLSILWSILCILGLFIVELYHNAVKKVPETDPSSFATLKNVTKNYGWYKKKTAVNDMSMSIKRNEMFAVLGPNGCGKTTTLSMLTAQAYPTDGSIHVNGLHTSSNRLSVIKQIGYCPQFDDLLIPGMSVGDHLRLFCNMNGIDSSVSEDYIASLLNAFGILSFKNVPCGNLSGGTKRKVSAAIAVMLPRSMVVLDEASTGLDPLARQKLWSTVGLLNVNRTSILTTHYISETSVCDRIAIMKEGQLKCCDTEHSLSKMFSQGYQVSLYFNQTPNNLMEFVRGPLLNGVECFFAVDNVIGNVAIVDLKSFACSVGTLVTKLLEQKRDGVLADFLLSRMTLENVFLDISRGAASPGPPTADTNALVTPSP